MPDDWSLVTLQDAAEVTIGRQRSPKNATGDHMTRYLRSANVTDGQLDLSADVDAVERRVLPRGDEGAAGAASATMLKRAAGDWPRR